MDDLISRQAAIDLIETDKIDGDSPFISLPRAQAVNRTCDRHVEGIKNLPSAQKTGAWIKMSDSDGIYYACSQCGEDIPRIAHFEPQYCPNCGARMESE